MTESYPNDPTEEADLNIGPDATPEEIAAA